MFPHYLAALAPASLFQEANLSFIYCQTRTKLSVLCRIWSGICTCAKSHTIDFLI